MTNKIYTIDCGKNTATIYNGKIVTTVSREEVLSLCDTLEPGSKLIGEYSHFACPREKLSKAQPFTAEELSAWYKRLEKNNIQLKLFPQQSTPRACIYAFGYDKDENGKVITDGKGKRKLTKSDETDPIALFKLVKDFPSISLMDPPAFFGEDVLREEGNSWKEYTNIILNEARSEYNNKGFDDSNTLWLKENAGVIMSQLSSIAKSVFGYDNFYKKNVPKKGVKKGDLMRDKIRRPQIYSILALLRTEEGELRKRELTNALPGWKFIKKYVLCMSPFHFKGGVARSNLYFHGLKNWVIKMAKDNHNLSLRSKNRGEFSKEEDAVFLKYRAQYTGAIKELFTVFKAMLEE